MAAGKRRARARLDDLPEVLSADEVANVLGIGLPHVRRLVKDGHIRRLPIGGRHIRVPRHEVERYLRESIAGAS